MKQEWKTDSEGFRLRCTHMTRLDAFSDVVFGFALTLLIVSLEVPKTFDELTEALTGFIAFALCFTFLIWVWHKHYAYFRRYGIEDQPNIALNALLLFVILFFVYPMKFLATVSTGQFTQSFVAGGREVFSSQHQVAQLMMMYGLGYAAVFLLFVFFYLRAWGKREALGLNALERLLTVESMVDAAGDAFIGLLCAVIAMGMNGAHAGMAGFVFFLTGVFKTVRGAYFGRQRKKLKGAAVA